MKSGRLLIEPVWNWNMIRQLWITWISTFNRTSLELKPSSSVSKSSRVSLLIEPVWNWNLSFAIFFPFLTFTFNRTSLELKHQIYKEFRCVVYSFNRTSLELKRLKWWGARWSTKAPFNRTSLELKLNLFKKSSTFPSLLIEPVWNWNICEIYTQFGSRSLLIEPVWNWNDFSIDKAWQQIPF